MPEQHLPDNRMWVKCGECGHVWPAFRLPMDMSKSVRLMNKLFCPECAEESELFVALKDDIPAGETGLL